MTPDQLRAAPRASSLRIANLAMVVVCVVSVWLSFALPDLERIRERGRPLAFVLVTAWLVVVFWNAGRDRTPGLVALMVATAAALTLPLWLSGYLGTPEALLGGILAAALGIFGPLGGERRSGRPQDPGR